MDMNSYMFTTMSLLGLTRQRTRNQGENEMKDKEIDIACNVGIDGSEQYKKGCVSLPFFFLSLFNITHLTLCTPSSKPIVFLRLSLLLTGSTGWVSALK
ncbi:uncharacterized protein B0P05DRAFT_311751 [Gilbertella persicaria]|uniref:uncharacterized protein n=1 Tax=Gilbertella persicaria TaxID=101096 RepID=UPI002221255F|nr:uncharacterized protein B0P05DRAFT_311751 [Gilbertella persicaria]KAI8051881.1 hypothetical protein B0P05DRAFT_311751 [Gilbertella persicaria]